MRYSLKRLAPACMLAVFALACDQTEPVSPDATAVPGPAFHASSTGPLHGAIFTTTVDGTIVNENVRYEAKEDVYLDGGPGPNAPATAAGLPEGDYYFQVTDPSGKDLLSTDHISCRQIHVNEHGVISLVYSGFDYEWQNGQNAHWEPVLCQHNQGTDVDHSELGAITVQLYPYDDTPNPGGVYKVWITPIEYYDPSSPFDPTSTDKHDAVNGEGWEAGNAHGFIPHHSKTDNYKVKQKGPKVEPPEITVIKFHDANANGIWDGGEEEVTGWLVDYSVWLEGDVVPSDVGSGYTQFTLIAADAGDYVFTEDTPGGTLQTVSMLNDVSVSEYPTADAVVTVTVTADYSMKADQEIHTVIYGNVGLGQVTACKYYDANGNGQVDEGEDPPVAGLAVQLSGTTVLDVQVFAVQTTGSDGCTTFGNLLPGLYSVEEIVPVGWVAGGPTVSDVFTIESTLSGASMSGGSHEAAFLNYCEATADFGTKGYWHNKNGLGEITQDDIDYVNGLPPYDGDPWPGPFTYFDDGDEPFDGTFHDGTPVDAAFNNDDGSLIWGAGTAQAEISQFLVDANAGGDPREQLAQQLLAFIFNTIHRLDGGGAIWDGSGWVSAQDLIDDAIAAWESGTDAERTAIKDVLDAYNNSDALPYIPATPCDVVYP